VRVNGAPVRKSYVPDAGDVIEAEIPAAAPTALEPEDLPLEIVHEDEHLVVVDKPAGLVVHPAPGHETGTLVHALLHRVGRLSSVGGDTRPGIVHRLDKDTSGLMVIARTDEAHRALSDALSRRQVRRGYVAAAWGGLEMEDDGLTIDRPIGRDPNDRKKMAVVEGGRPAVTHVRRIESWRSAELLAIRLETGRTHQVRVHLRSLGHPVVCDPIYAPGWERGFLGAGGRWAEALARRAQRLFLHAAHLAFEHPLTGEDLSFRADLPEPLASAVDWARQSGHADSQSPAGQSR
jgi:23S rRNA pseudouridine1911/1915/1917 synthase